MLEVVMKSLDLGFILYWENLHEIGAIIDYLQNSVRQDYAINLEG